MTVLPRASSRRQLSGVVNIAPERRPQGQLPVPDVANLAALVTGRAFERLETDEARVAIPDAVAVLRLAHEIEHDDALAERDTARRQMEEWKVGLCPFQESDLCAVGGELGEYVAHGCTPRRSAAREGGLTRPVHSLPVVHGRQRSFCRGPAEPSRRALPLCARIRL